MVKSIILPSGNVFIDKPFSCFLNKRAGEVTVSGGCIIPIYSRQRAIKIENEGAPILLSSLREIYLQIKTTPLTNEIEKAKFVTEEEVKEIKKSSDSSLNMFLPICRYDENWNRLDGNFFNANFNYTRQKGDEPLQGYYDDGKVYLNGFLLIDSISNSLLDKRFYPSQIISAQDGDFIVAKIKVDYNEDPDEESQITEFVIENGESLYEASLFSEEIDGLTPPMYARSSIERRFPIGYVKDGSYISLKTGNIEIDLVDYRNETTYTGEDGETRVTGYSITVL